MTEELIGMGQVREMLYGLPVTSDWLARYANIQPVGVFGNNSALYRRDRIECFAALFKRGVATAAQYAGDNLGGLYVVVDKRGAQAVRA